MWPLSSRVILDDLREIKGDGNIFFGRQTPDLSGLVLRIESEPAGRLVLFQPDGESREERMAAACLAHACPLAGAEEARGDPRRSAVHQDMAVSDELPGDPARGGEAKAEDDVIKPPLEELSQGLRCFPARCAPGGAEEAFQLGVGQAVEETYLLFLGKLDAEFREAAAPPAAVHAGWVWPAHHGRFRSGIALGFQEEFLADSALDMRWSVELHEIIRIYESIRMPRIRLHGFKN